MKKARQAAISPHKLRALLPHDKFEDQQNGERKNEQAKEYQGKVETGHLAGRRHVNVNEVVVRQRLTGDAGVFDRPVMLRVGRDGYPARIVREVVHALLARERRGREVRQADVGDRSNTDGRQQPRKRPWRRQGGVQGDGWWSTGAHHGQRWQPDHQRVRQEQATRRPRR